MNADEQIGDYEDVTLRVLITTIAELQKRLLIVERSNEELTKDVRELDGVDWADFPD